MFKELHAAANRAPVILRISAEGEGLRVMIHQKADDLDKGEIPLAISVAGSPEQLDAELPAAIAEACSTLKTAEPIAEQVRRQTDTAIKNAVPTRKPAAAKKTPTPAKKKAPAPKPKKQPKPTAAKKTAAEKTDKPVKHIASRPTAEQCIAAYHAYATAHPGEPIKREPFMKDNPTGRRFERLFGNWEKFVEAAQKDSPAESAAAQDPDSARTGSAASSSESPAPADAASATPAPAAVLNNTGRSVVMAASGVTIAAGVELTAETDQVITVPGRSDPVRVVDFSDKTIYVEPVENAQQQQTAGATA